MDSSVLLTLFDIGFGCGLISSNSAPQWKPADVLFILSEITRPDINHILLLGGSSPTMDWKRPPLPPNNGALRLSALISSSPRWLSLPRPSVRHRERSGRSSFRHACGVQIKWELRPRLMVSFKIMLRPEIARGLLSTPSSPGFFFSGLQ